MQILVLGVTVFQRKDGTHGARIVVASTPRNPNHRGLAAAELEATLEVADTMKVFPAIYKLDFELPVARGYGRPNEARPLITGATLVAPVVPGRKENAPA